ncbi:hypothetical protein SUDANB95_02829 [Actinosynnema sp. ALI-1.44]
MKVKRSPMGYQELYLGDSEWDDGALTRFHDAGCNGVVVSGWRRDVRFLRDVPGLESVRIMGAIKDLSAVAELDGLQALHVDVLTRAPVDLGNLRQLEALFIGWHPELAGLAQLRALRTLTIFGWGAPDFRAFADMPELRFLRVEMKRRHAAASAGLVGARAATRMWFYDGRLTDVEELAEFTAVTEIAFRGTKIDSVGFVTAMPLLAHLELDSAGEVESIAPLRDHPSLEFVAIAGSTRVADGDLSVLFEMPKLRAVGIDQNAPHYSHRAIEIRNAFPPSS